jgi:fatty acid desaturase
MNPTPLSDHPHNRLLLWSCMWGGGVLWLFHLVAVWLAAEFGCLTALAKLGPLGISWVAWVILAVSVVILLLTGVITWISWHHSRGGGASDGERPGRFAARVGLVANPLFGLVIIAETLPIFYYLKDCGTYLL